MLVAKFNCTQCDAVLKPAAPQPSGKKLRCPKCAQVTVVPSPEEEEVEELEAVEEVDMLEEAEPPRKRPGSIRRDEQDEESPPSRRRASRDDEYDDEERPRKSSKRSRKAKGGSGVKIAILVGSGLLVLVGLSVGGYFLLSGKGSGLFGDPTLKAFNEVASVLSGVKDQNSAQAARPTLVALGQRIRESWERDMATLAKFDAATLDKAMEDARRNPEKAKANAERVRKEQEALNTVMEEVTRQAARVKEVPGGKELLEAFWDASGEGGRLLKGIWESKMNLQQRGKGIDTSSPPTSATPANYAQIRPGMTDYQVLGILGVPLRTDSTKSGIKTFVYAIGNVDVKDGKVVSKVP